MHVAVLLLSLADNPRRTAFTREWAEGCVGVAGDYFAAQSAGRVAITWTVYDWVELSMTEQEWVTLSASGIDGVVDLVTPMLPAGSDLRGGVDHILVGIDSLNSSGGTTPGAFTYLGAVNFTPSFIGHEFGHRFGASDAFGAAAQGRRRYEHDFCVMGAMGRPDTYPDERLDDDAAPGLAGTGPGMSAPTLMACGWLDPAQHGLVEDLSGATSITHGMTLSLSALTGSPGMAWTGPPVAVRFFDDVVEYRVTTGWDRGIQVGGGALGKLIVNASPASAPVAEFVAAVDAVPGAVLTLGPDDPFDLDTPGPLVIRVLAVDAADDIVHLSLSRRAARVGPGGGVSVGTGTDGDGGGWVWTEGRGLRRIPPYSPLHDSLSLISDLAALHELAETSPRNDELVRPRAVATLAALQRSVRRVTAEPAPSPLQRARNGLAALESARRRLATEAGQTQLGQEYLDTTQAAIDQLTPLVQTATRNERRR